MTTCGPFVTVSQASGSAPSLWFCFIVYSAVPSKKDDAKKLAKVHFAFIM